MLGETEERGRQRKEADREKIERTENEEIQQAGPWRGWGRRSSGMLRKGREHKIEHKSSGGVDALNPA